MVMKSTNYIEAFFAAVLSLTLTCNTAAAEELFYENCSDGLCQNRYLVGKEKLSEGHYKAKVMLLNYRGKSSGEADEHYKYAEVVCDKAKPSVTWKNEKSQGIDKSVFAAKVVKKGGKAADDPVKKYDEITSLWKKVCHL